MHPQPLRNRQSLTSARPMMDARARCCAPGAARNTTRRSPGMWCDECRQDVPADHSAPDGGIRCARCGTTFPGHLAGPAPDCTWKEKTLPEPARPFTPTESWEIDEDLRHIGRIVKSVADDASSDAGQAIDELLPAPARGRTQKVDAPPRPWLRACLAWPALCAGTCAVTCGLVLAAWSLLGGRADLWRVGCPTAIGGMGAALVGLAVRPRRPAEHTTFAMRIDARHSALQAPHRRTPGRRGRLDRKRSRTRAQPI
jgi:hypothetical protein